MKALEIPLPEWIAAAKARAEAATLGRWTAYHLPDNAQSVISAPNYDGTGTGFEDIGAVYHLRPITGKPERPQARDDAEFIAHARLDVPALCEALERVLALADETERRLDTAKGLAVALTADAEDIPETAMTATIRTLIERFRRAVEGPRP